MSKWTRCVACLIVLSVGLSATAAPPTPRKGVDTEKEVVGGYSSQHKRQITRIARGGDLDAWLDYFSMFLNFAPNDRESLYGMVVAQAQKKTIKKIERAAQNVKRAKS